MGFRIKTVAELTGIPRETLIAWERRYSLVEPKRQDNGFREYDENDVALLKELKRLVDRGHAPSEAVSMLKGRTPSTPASPKGSANLEEARTRVQEALLSFDRAVADQASAILGGISFEDQLHGFYYPLLREVGAMWEKGAVTIAQEHHATAWCRDRIVAMLLQLGGRHHGPTVMVACYPGERHEVGPLGLAVQLALRGHRIIWLGADVPLADLCVAVRDKKPEMVCVSATMPPDPNALVTYARRLRSSAPEKTRVAIGGPGVPADTLPQVEGVMWEGTAEGL